MTVRHVCTIIGLAALCVWPAAAGQQRTDPEVLFQSALYMEQVELRLDQAIAGYKDVVAAAGTNTGVAAKALLQMAGCYERLGKPEAAQVYQRIVNEYATSGAVATAARTKLAAMEQKGAGPAVRKVWDQLVYAISPDGRYLTYTDWDTGNLGVHDVTSGHDRVLTTDAQMPVRFAESAVPSPDGRLIAYNWRDFGEGRPGDLRVISRDGGRPIVVYPNAEKADLVRPVGWTPNGKEILAYVQKRTADGPVIRDLLLVPATGGAARLVKRFEDASRDFRISPDGRAVAYNRPATQGRSELDLFVLSLDSGREVAMRPHAANDYVLDWFPEGDRILFASDRAGSNGIWAARVVNGKLDGEPLLIRPDAGRVQAHGFTRKGDFYYSTIAAESEVYLAALDSATGKQTGPLTRLEGRYTGFKTQAAWSPDGGRMAYVQEPLAMVSGPDRNQRLVIQTMATGTMNSLTLALQNMQNPAWLPDGRSVIVQGRDLEGRQGLHLVNIETGALTTVAVREPANDIRRIQAAPSPDGRRVFFQWSAPAAPGQDVIGVRDLASGTEKKLTTQAVDSFALSPDGRQLAAMRPEDGKGPLLFVMPSAGGELRPLAADVSGWSTAAVAWGHDGTSVFVAKNEVTLTSEIWQVPVDGNAPRNTGIRWPGSIMRISAHPDGRRLAISTSGLASETWALQNIPPQREK